MAVLGGEGDQVFDCRNDFTNFDRASEKPRPAAGGPFVNRRRDEDCGHIVVAVEQAGRGRRERLYGGRLQNYRRDGPSVALDMRYRECVRRICSADRVIAAFAERRSDVDTRPVLG